MVRSEVQKTNKFIALGVLAAALAGVLSDVAYIFIVAAWILFFIACMAFAKAKGYSQALGVILGLLGLIGLIIIFFLPDKMKDGGFKPAQ